MKLEATSKGWRQTVSEFKLTESKTPPSAKDDDTLVKVLANDPYLISTIEEKPHHDFVIKNASRASVIVVENPAPDVVCNVTATFSLSGPINEARDMDDFISAFVNTLEAAARPPSVLQIHGAFDPKTTVTLHHIQSYMSKIKLIIDISSATFKFGNFYAILKHLAETLKSPEIVDLRNVAISHTVIVINNTALRKLLQTGVKIFNAKSPIHIVKTMKEAEAQTI